MTTVRDALEAARRRYSDEELSVPRLVGRAYHALPNGADVDEVRRAAEEVLGDERVPPRPSDGVERAGGEA